MPSLHNQPFPTNQSVYPYNNVTQTRSGHVFEVDDTLGNERIHEKHKSGTCRTIDATGALSVTVVSNRYTTVCGEDSISIIGNANITINGSANLTVNGDYNVEVNGSMSQTVKGQYRLKVGGAYKNEVLGDKAENIAGKKDSIIGNGVNNTIRGGGIKSMVVGSIEETVAGGYTGIYTGSSSTTALLGASMTAPAGAATIGGMTAAIDGVSMLTLTSLGPTNMFSTVTNMTTPLVNILGGALIAAGDVRALAGARGLLTHIHLGDGAPGTPAPTSPPIAG
jgi:hypothetical protein